MEHVLETMWFVWQVKAGKSHIRIKIAVVIWISEQRTFSSVAPDSEGGINRKKKEN